MTQIKKARPQSEVTLQNREQAFFFSIRLAMTYSFASRLSRSAIYLLRAFAASSEASKAS